MFLNSAANEASERKISGIRAAAWQLTAIDTNETMGEDGMKRQADDLLFAHQPVQEAFCRQRTQPERYPAWISAAVLLLCFCLSFIPQKPVQGQRSLYKKYYTSICLEEGDTLWSIALRYNVYSDKSTQEYVRELRRMNGLSDDTIHAGHYLTISYYSPSPPDTGFRGGNEDGDMIYCKKP